MHKNKSLLFRKQNKKTHHIRRVGGDFRNSRNVKKETREQTKGSMFGRRERGLDYTPLYHFLLSKVGKKWDDIYRDVKSRLMTTDPIFHLVALNESDRSDFVRTGESTYFSGLYIDENGLLQFSNPTLTAKEMRPFCTCCTHTFNGVLFGVD